MAATFVTLVSLCALVDVSPVEHAEGELTIPLDLPELTRLETAFTTSSGAIVTIELNVGYDGAGKIAPSGDCLVNQIPVSVKGKVILKSSYGVPGYKITASNKALGIKAELAGPLNAAFSSTEVNYKGPDGTARFPGQAAEITTRSVLLTLCLKPIPLGLGGKFAGSGEITGGFHGTPGSGSLRMKKSSDTLKFKLSAGKQSINFTGRIVGQEYIGALKCICPPAKWVDEGFRVSLEPGCGSGSGPEPTPVDVNGARRIIEAGELPTEPEVEGPTSEPEVKSIPDDTGLPMVCSFQDFGASQVRDLIDRVGLDLNGTTVYPGGGLQGGDLLNGNFTPLTPARAGGTVVLSGLKLNPGATYQRHLDRISYGNVKQAIEDILSEGAQGTEANIGFELSTVHSNEEMLYWLGIDLRFGPARMKGRLSIGQKANKSYVFVKFIQKFYDVTFEDPELSTSIFRDGDRYADPENQIRPGNPPLYVSKVSYGRILFLVAESDFDAEDVKAALEAAYKGLASSVKVRSLFSHQQIMEKSRIHYYVVGGAADLALAPIDSAGPLEMYEAVKQLLAKKESANYSASNPGTPIAYTLNYLKDRRPARMSYSVLYTAKNCDFRGCCVDPIVPDSISYVPPHTGGGDRDFYGHGPRMSCIVEMQISPERDSLQARVFLKAEEYENNKRRDNFTTAEGWSGWATVFRCPPEARIVPRSFPPVAYSYTDTDHSVDVFPIHSGFVDELRFVGDTHGDEAGDRTAVTVTFSPLSLEFE